MVKTVKKRKGERLPSHRLHKPSGRGVVSLTGRDHYTGKFGTRAADAEYRRLLAEWLANDRAPIKKAKQADDADDDALTINGLAVQYFAWAKRTYVKNGELTSESKILERAIRPLVKMFGVLDVNGFGPKALEQVRDVMVKRGLARSTVNVMISKLKRMFKWGVAKELVKPEVFTALSTVEGLKRGRTSAREPKSTRPPPPDWMEKVLPHLREPSRSAVKLQRLTGMRIGELFQMRPCDLDRTGDVWEYRPTSHKTEATGADRVILIGPKGIEVLRPLLDDLPPTQRVFSWRRGKRKGRPLKLNSFTERLKTACERAGVEYFRPHSLRHARLTEIRDTLGLDFAQATGGHSRASMTERYARVMASKAAEAAKESG